MGVVHGVRVFTPMMLEAAKKDPGYEGHIVNTASMAGLLNAPNMGVYNVSKHAVVALSETLYQDLRLVTDQIGASVLCPFFVPTGITESDRNRPDALRDDGREADEEPADRQGDEREGRQQRQGHGRAGRGIRDGRGRERPLLHLQPPEVAGERADAARRHHAGAQPDRSVRGKPEIGSALKAALRAAD